MKKFTVVLLVALLAMTAVFANSQKETASSGLEDKITIYCTLTDAQIDTYVYDLFQAHYPDVEIEIVNGSIGELMARVKAEKDKPNGDIVFGGLSETDGDIYADYFEQYTTKHEKDLIEGYQSDNGYSNYWALATVCFVVNKDLEKQLGMNITSYQDLLDPRLKGKIAFSDPNSSSAALSNLSNMAAVFGTNTAAFWDYIDKLMPNLVILSSSSSVYKGPGNGEYVVGMTYENGVATLLASGNDKVKMVYPKEGTSAMATGVAIIKDCNHPNISKAFVDLIMSAEGQSEASAIYKTDRLTNAKAKQAEDALLPAASTITWVKRPAAEVTAQKAEILAKWNELYAKYHK